MDIKKIKAIFDMVADANVSEVEICEADSKIRIVKFQTSQGGVPTAFATPETMPLMPPKPAFKEDMMLPVVSPPAGFVVISPMVGTFYRAVNVQSEPFVTMGSVVKAKDVLCIIEAMKIFNEINSDRDGTITQILAENGATVEFGQPLFVIE
ncbi:MAG: acetyl-CoA carboxylase biotin carboxyl carrier protein [Gammaproteobacteria bacterium]|nr:acetyl-CoA carboxylase biotin carboxyl carrier protein [Gammaproteobacteria bacterium]